MNTPKIDETFHKLNHPTSHSFQIALGMRKFARELEHTLRQVADTAAFHDMPDEVIEAVNKALEITNS